MLSSEKYLPALKELIAKGETWRKENEKYKNKDGSVTEWVPGYGWTTTLTLGPPNPEIPIHENGPGWVALPDRIQLWG
jgi:hypothetical protein